MHRRRSLEQSFLDGVAVQGGDRAEPTSDRGACAADVLKVAGEAFNVVTGDIEQRQLALLTPGGELAKIQGVRVTRES
jgi:hypothetical protein